MSRPRALAVLDQGSSATKAAVYRGPGAWTARRELAVGLRADGAGAEHDPAEVAAGVGRLLEELAREPGVEAVGLTCQRSTCLVWDRETGAPLTPAVSWQDRRQAPRVEALAPHAGEVSRRTGLRLSPHYAAPKLAALLEGLPRGRQRAAAGELVAGTLDAFLLRRLTGRGTTEPGHAGRTLLFNLEEGSWDPWLCDLFGVPAAALPEVLPSAGSRGEAGGLPLTGLAGDQQAALLGHGGWREGRTAVHLGTGAFVLGATGETPRRHPGLLTAVLASTATCRRFQLEGSVNSAGSAVDWACRLTGREIGDWEVPELDPEHLPRLLPAFAGAAAPWWRPQASAVIAGLGLESGPQTLAAAVLAGVAMRILDCTEALAEAGAPPGVLRLSGRLARLEALTGLLADAGQLPVEVAGEEEAGLEGIGRLALAGLTGRQEPLGEEPLPGRRREPRWEPARARRVREGWRTFAAAALELPL